MREQGTITGIGYGSHSPISHSQLPTNLNCEILSKHLTYMYISGCECYMYTITSVLQHSISHICTVGSVCMINMYLRNVHDHPRTVNRNDCPKIYMYMGYTCASTNHCSDCGLQCIATRLPHLQFVYDGSDSAENFWLPGLGDVATVVPQDGIEQGREEVLTNLQRVVKNRRDRWRERWEYTHIIIYMRTTTP